MKLNPFFRYIILLIFFLSPSICASVEEDLKKITSKLRCMTCQNQTVYSSDTDFASNIKKIVENKLKNNDSEEEIIDFLIYRYGEYILFEPQMNKQNLFLWFFPFVILVLSLVFLTLKIKKSSPNK
jgi:cytochrome c-type biogenesis protein CcmH